ncbi:MAG: hemolysin family protein [Nitrospinota bacterium]
MSLEAALAIIFVCLAAEFFFSGAELAMVAADRIRLKNRADSGQWGPRMALNLLEAPERLVATTLTCHNVAFVTNVTIGTWLILTFADPRYGEILTLLVMTPLLLIVGEIVPKSLFREKADLIAPKAAYVVWTASKVFFPIIYLVTGITRLFLKHSEEERSVSVTREELDLMLQRKTGGGDVHVEERRIIHRIFGFGDTTAREARVPLVEVTDMPETAAVGEVVLRMVEKAYSRIPIYREETHNIVGVVTAFDVLTAPADDKDLKEYVRPVLYVPESMPADDLLRTLRDRGEHLAVVVDEYGGSVGIVTVEDLLEEIVGEIYDEHQEAPTFYERLPDGSFRIDARMEVDAINETLGLGLPKGRYETLAGFVTKTLERIPREGEEFESAGLKFRVTDSTPKRVLEVVVRRMG